MSVCPARCRCHLAGAVCVLLWSKRASRRAGGQGEAELEVVSGRPRRPCEALRQASALGGRPLGATAPCCLATSARRLAIGCAQRRQGRRPMGRCLAVRERRCHSAGWVTWCWVCWGCGTAAMAARRRGGLLVAPEESFCVQLSVFSSLCDPGGVRHRAACGVFFTVALRSSSSCSFRGSLHHFSPEESFVVQLLVLF